MTDPEWRISAGDETTLIRAGPGLPAAEAYWLAVRENPDDLANTMPDDAFLALVDMVRKTGELDAVVADRDALCDFVAAHDAVEHLIAGGVADDLRALRQQYERWAAEPVADAAADLLVEVAAALGWPALGEVGEHRGLHPAGADSDSAAVERLCEARAGNRSDHPCPGCVVRGRPDAGPVRRPRQGHDPRCRRRRHLPPRPRSRRRLRLVNETARQLRDALAVVLEERNLLDQRP
jgi:hypothetical protein